MFSDGRISSGVSPSVGGVSGKASTTDAPSGAPAGGAAAVGYPQRAAQVEHSQSREQGGAEGPGGLVPLSISDTVTFHSHDLRVSRLRRAVKTAARLHGEEVPRFKTAMLTLTYAPGQEWAAFQITALMKCIREYLRRRGAVFRYVWVLELTKAGVPHYHVMLWLPRGVTLPKPDKRGWWPYGHTRIEWARYPVAYLAKYASKGYSGKLPEGARLHGCGGLSLTGRLERAWWLVPSYVREVWNAEQKPNRAHGGGWRNKEGEWMPSRFRIVWGLTCFPFITLRPVGVT